MQRILTLVLLAVVGVQAQTVNVRGKVVNGSGANVANAIAELTTLKLKDTTGTDGAYTLMGSVTSIQGAAQSLAQSSQDALSFQQGILHWTLSKSQPVKVEVLDSKGRLLFRELYRDISHGNYRLDLRDKFTSNEMAFVRASIGGAVHSFHYLPMSHEEAGYPTPAASTAVSARLAKVAATLDSLKVSATGYTPKTIPLSTYDTTVNVTLVSAQNKISAGCGSANPLKTGTFTESINGTNRRWMVDVPANYDPQKPYRLIFVWHPLGGSGSQVVSGGFNGLKTLSQNSAIFATADGLMGSNNETSGTGWWNANGGDMKLVQAMLDKINAGLCIDQERIFSTGFSFGGMMSYTLPFEFDVFRAIAPCSGKVGVIDYTTKFTRPIPILAFHGNNDTFVLTSLGKQFFDRYATRNQCGTQTRAVTPNGCSEYQGCAASSTWCLFNGGHVTWSEQPAAIWKFFSQF